MCKQYLHLLTLLPLAVACEKMDCSQLPEQNLGLITRSLPTGYLAYDAKSGTDLSMNGIRITSVEQYERVFNDCCAGRLETVDFSRYEVLGLSTVNRGCSSTYQRDVQRNDATNRVTYTVSESYCRRCSPTTGNGNFVVIPKLPEGAQVEFRRQQ